MLQPAPGYAHWEAIEQILHYLPDTPNPRFAHVEVSSPQKGHSNAMAAWPWTGAPHWGTYPSPSRTTTSHRCTAARRHCGLAAPSQPPSGNPTTPFSSNQAAIVTTRERRDHYHHHHHHHHHRDQAHRSSTVADMLTSPCFRQGMALRRVPWTACKVRGSVAKAAVGPQCSGLALSSVNTYSHLFYHTNP